MLKNGPLADVFFKLILRKFMEKCRGQEIQPSHPEPVLSK
jgi:hypothetical protein